MRQPRNFEVAKEVLDVWRPLCGLIIVVTSPSNRYNAISLSNHLKISIVACKVW